MTTAAHSLLLDALTSTAWAMHEPVLRSLCAIIDRHIRGERLTSPEIETATGRRTAEPAPQPELDVRDGTAIIHVDGVIAKYASQVGGVSQPRGTSVESLSRFLAEAGDSPEVRDVVLRIESPGGNSYGLPTLADQVLELSQRKPVIAYADDMAASGAYWIGSQASRFYASPSADVGSIGVYCVLPDYSRALENDGVRINLITTGRHKSVGAFGTAIAADQLEPFQRIIDDVLNQFTAAILRGREARGLTMEILAPQADGRIFSAKDALAGRLIDGIMTLPQALASARPAPRMRAMMVTTGAGNGEQGTGNRAESETVNPERKEIDMADQSTPPKKTVADTTPPAPPAPDATALERLRITAIDAALSPVECLRDLRARAISEGLSPEAAKAAAFDLLVGALAAQTKGSADALATAQADHAAAVKVLQNRLDAIAKGAAGLQAPPGGAAGPAADGEDPAVYEAAVQEGLAAKKTVAEAHRNAAVKFPKAHAAWIAASQK